MCNKTNCYCDSCQAAIGTQGPVGPQGNPGTNGTNGTNGLNGASGAPGSNGNNGIDGTNGTNGINGATGATGAAGTPGATGATGPQGLTGNNGNNGANGAPGTAATIAVGSVTALAPGSTPTVVNSGTTGAAVFNFGLTTGNTGATGATGAAGASGLHASMWHDESTVTVGNPIGFVSESISPGSTSVWGPYGGVWLQATPSAGNSFFQTFILTGGTYTLYCLGLTGTGSGIVSWYIDSVLQGTMDWYSASTVFPVTKTIAVTVPALTQHTLTGIISTKNGSSTGYGLAVTKYWIY